MFHSDIEIKEGAFVISDAHYSEKRPELLEFLQAIDSAILQPTQIIFLGDIFDTLFGKVQYTQIKNHKLITLINKISQKLEIIYLEGNHDFALKYIFTNFKIYPLSQQPILCNYKDKKCLLAHGDFDAPTGYQIYTKIIRNKFVLITLSFIDKVLNHKIFIKLEKYLSKKKDCNEIKNFDTLIKKRIEKNYKCDYFIEGHFHQGKKYKYGNINYINIAAFACNQRYFIVKSLDNRELLEENIFFKGT